ncbi:MAG TPA: hypothetical protein QF564_30560 [Pirellulaceae bacterium]|nr:hypothetical protein [Pirellulaceae bacterium]
MNFCPAQNSLDHHSESDKVIELRCCPMSVVFFVEIGQTDMAGVNGMNEKAKWNVPQVLKQT